MQNHCKSTKQTDLGKSVWVGAVFSYNQEQLWASQSAGVIGRVQREKGVLEILQWQAWDGRGAQDA